jgi:hypothetical protein
MVLPIALSTLAVVLIAVGALAALLFVGGLIAMSRRDRRRAGVYAEHVAAANQALEEARAADKGWNPQTMETAARNALAEARPGFQAEHLHLVLVDDRPGMTDDRAHFMAVGPDGEARIVLTRMEGGDWTSERVE